MVPFHPCIHLSKWEKLVFFCSQPTCASAEVCICARGEGGGGAGLRAGANNLTDYPTVAAALSVEQDKYRAVWKCRRLLGTLPPAPLSSHLCGPVHCSMATITLIGRSKRTGKCSSCSYLSTVSPKGSEQDVPSKRQWQRPCTQNRGLFLWTVASHLEVLSPLQHHHHHHPLQHCSQKKDL